MGGETDLQKKEIIFILNVQHSKNINFHKIDTNFVLGSET